MIAQDGMKKPQWSNNKGNTSRGPISRTKEAQYLATCAALFNDSDEYKLIPSAKRMLNKLFDSTQSLSPDDNRLLQALLEVQKDF